MNKMASALAVAQFSTVIEARRLPGTPRLCPGSASQTPMPA
jgi:hypothetical protein